MDKKLKTPMTILFVGAILYLFESIADILLNEYYHLLMDGMNGQPVAQEVSTIFVVMGVMGIIASLFLIWFVSYMQKTKPTRTQFITILVISAFGIFMTSALFSPIILIVGSIMGINRTK